MKRHTYIIGLIVLVLLSSFPVPAADTSSDTRELKRIEQEMRDKKLKLRQTDRKERSIYSELERIERESQAQGRELAEQQRRLRDAETALAEIVQTRGSVQQDAARLKPLFTARLRAIYKMKRSGGYALAVLSASDAASFSRRARALASVVERDHLLLAEYQTALIRLNDWRREAGERQEEILSSTEAVEAKRRELESQRRKKTILLASVQRQKSMYEETLAELEESSKNLWAAVREAERRRREAPKAAPELQAPEQGGLPWPVAGAVLTRFGSQRHPRFGTMVFRRGIDINVKVGDEVRAVAAGTVMHADWVKGYGQLVVVDHGSGMYTLYGHLSGINVQKDERIAARQVIGSAGDTGSLAGPRLYFELRKNGEAEDPLRWLAKW